MAGREAVRAPRAVSRSSTLTGSGSEKRQISDVQRVRLLAAMTEVACERGAAGTTVADVVRKAGVSRRTFYEQFADQDDCALAAFVSAIERAGRRIAKRYLQHDRWRDRMRSSLEELLGFLEEEPSVGWLLIVYPLGAGPRVLDRRRHALDRVIAAVDEGRGESRDGTDPSPLTAECVVGAAFSVVHARMLEPGRAPLTELTSELMGMIVLPYLGVAAARRELARPAPESPRGSSTGLGALGELEMRLTYRTMRVLLAIGSHPGASNRQIADASDIHDQGQVSKLLRRLQALGLAANGSRGRVKGEANAWTLTAMGASVQRAISAQTLGC